MSKPVNKRLPPDISEAEAIAAQALAFLAEDGPRLVRFLGLTGIDIPTLRARAGSREVLTAVLDHLSGDESLLLVFAAEAKLAPETVLAALDTLQPTHR